MKKIIIIFVVLLISFFVLINSGAISKKRTIEKRNDLEYTVKRWEWHPERVPKYFKSKWGEISGSIKDAKKTEKVKKSKK